MICGRRSVACTAWSRIPALCALLLLPASAAAGPAHLDQGGSPAAAQAASQPAPQAASQPAPQAAVIPQDITVGDVFHAAVRFTLPAGVQLAAPDSLVLPEELGPAGRREIRFDTVGMGDTGGRRVTVAYPLNAWRPGTYELPPVAIRLRGAGTDTVFAVALPAFDVRSVLPADTAGIEPRPARDVLGRNRLWWPILLALLLAAIVAGALYYWWRRRRRPEPENVVDAPSLLPPRTAALARLQELRRSGVIERGEHKRYYDELTETLRQYMGALRPEWSTDLTTGELAARMNGRRPPDAAVAGAEVLAILRAADLVKFARERTTSEAAWRDLDAVEAWIRRAEPEPVAPGTDDRRVV